MVVGGEADEDDYAVFEDVVGAGIETAEAVPDETTNGDV